MTVEEVVVEVVVRAVEAVEVLEEEKEEGWEGGCGGGGGGWVEGEVTCVTMQANCASCAVVMYLNQREPHAVRRGWRRRGGYTSGRGITSQGRAMRARQGRARRAYRFHQMSRVCRERK